MSAATATHKKLDDLYELIDEMEIAMMTTRRPDGMMVTRPMATQERGEQADLWFVTSIETDKIDEISFDPNVSIGYFNSNSKEWVSISGTATVTQDRQKIHELYEPDWKIYFSDEGGDKDGGPDDPRLTLIFVDAHTAVYFKQTHSQPRVLFEMAKSAVTGEQPNMGRKGKLTRSELD